MARSFSAMISSRARAETRSASVRRIGEDLVSRVLRDLVGARDHLVRFLARLGDRRLTLGSRELSIAGCRLGILQPLADLLAALVEEREDPLEQESVQQVEEQQEVDDLEGELRQIDAERIEELHVGPSVAKIRISETTRQ